jgi:hypothetical protein
VPRVILFDERNTDEEEEAELSQAMDKYRYDAMQLQLDASSSVLTEGVYAVPVGSVIYERLGFLPRGATTTPFRVIHQEWGDGVRLLRVMAHGPGRGGLRVGVLTVHCLLGVTV